jgi:hypothetical protein
LILFAIGSMEDYVVFLTYCVQKVMPALNLMSIIRRDVGDGGLGLAEWDQDFADKQLKELVEMGKLEVVDPNTYRLTEEGKKHCLKTDD